MKPARARPAGRRFVSAGIATLALAGYGARAAAPVSAPPAGLQACVSIAADAERLACYDRLAGRVAAGAPAPVKGASSTAAAVAAPAAAATATATAPVAAAAPAPAAAMASPPAAAAAASAASAAAPAPAVSQSFGDYAAEHPKAPAAATNSIEARVAGVGSSASGHVTVLLEGGALWELDQPDPLLKVGDTVTITRAALGSYLMRTSSKREHRVRRLR